MPNDKLRVICDTCVLFSFTLRLFVFELMKAGRVEFVWSEHILGELRRKLREKKNLSDAQLQTVRRDFDSRPASLVEGYDRFIADISLDDPDDVHVVAAAIRGEANIIVTSNTADFPREVLERLKLRVMNPDRFVSELIDDDVTYVAEAVQRLNLRQKLYMRCSMRRTLEFLDRAGLHKSVIALRAYL